MEKKLFLAIVCIVTSLTNVFCQIRIEGKVISGTKKEPIPFANIGIINSTVGTNSFEDGSFTISIPKAYQNDTLIFAALGYAEQAIPVSSISNPAGLTVTLSEKPTVLDTVTVKVSREKKKDFELGNRYYRGGVTLYSDPEASNGTAAALLIENTKRVYNNGEKYPLYIEKARLRISDNTLDDFMVRVRIYDVDKATGLPDKDLLNESVIVKSDIRKGWLDFDLSKFNIAVEGPFFIAFEPIIDKKTHAFMLDKYNEFKRSNPQGVKIDTTVVDGEKIATVNYGNFLSGTSLGVSLLPYSLNTYKCFYRVNGMGEWKRTAYILAARVEVTNRPK